MKTQLLLLLAILLSSLMSAQDFTYIEVDNNRGKWGDTDEPVWLRYFGIDAADLNHDGLKDIASGRYIYLNPGDDMTGDWERLDVGFNVDIMLICNIDDDEYADVIAEALPDVYWLEADNHFGTAWKAMKIGNIPKTGHNNGQGYLMADIIKGGKKEILLAAHDGIYATEIPTNPVPENWKFVRIIETRSDEGFDAADIDNDGDLDIIAGDYDLTEKEEPKNLYWYVNPGGLKENWQKEPVGETEHAIDRIRVEDMNEDGVYDIIIAEERYPGKEPDANLYYYKGIKGGTHITWEPEILVTQYSMNNLDVADIDKDGDFDIVTNEHKGEEHKTQLFLNDGKGNFSARTIDTGNECHLGTQFFDMDNDGDLDIIGHAWDNYQYMHLWRNNEKSNLMSWKHLSSVNNDLPNTAGGNQQTSCLLADVDKDNIDEFFVTDRTVAPSVIMYKFNGKGWNKHIVDKDLLRIEAGSAFTDIDEDGDIDIVFGGESRSNEVWWWENPYPDFDPNTPWKRYNIKKSGKNKHHDQMFADIDGDGKQELVFWNQGGSSLCISEIPEKPRQKDDWDWEPIYVYSNDSEMDAVIGSENYPGWQAINEHEGLFAEDIDGDGIKDIIGGGRWFKYQDGKFIENIIDASYTFSRTVAGQFVEGGRPEVVLVVGDGKGPMYLYQWYGRNNSRANTGTWKKKLILPEVDNGHTIDVLDFNDDGHLDIFSAEMRFGEGNPDSEVRFLLGDGKGNFTNTVVIKGLGIHEGKLGDLDGDGDLDIVAKPYSWKSPRIDLLINENGK